MLRIESRSNKHAALLKKLAASKKQRRESGIYVCDGVKCLRDALRFGAPVRSVFFSDRINPGEFDIPDGVPVYCMPESLMDYVSESKTPQGALFTVSLPDTSLPETLEGSFYIALDDLQDPGNVGAILRSADAFGIEAVILAGSCADPFSPKALRGASGALFRMKAFECGQEELVGVARASGLRLIASELSGRSKNISEVDFRRSVVLIGNEGAGISSFMSANSDESFIIPMSPGCQSLNAAVAASIIIYEMKKM